jgi:hypothetical protein
MFNNTSKELLPPFSGQKVSIPEDLLTIHGDQNLGSYVDIFILVDV